MSITAAYSALHRLPAAQDSPAIFPCPEYAFQGTTIAVTFRDHPLQQDDLEFRYSMIGSLFSLMVQPAANARQTHRSAQMPAQLSDPAAFNFQNATREDVFLAFLLNGSRPCLIAYSGMA